MVRDAIPLTEPALGQAAPAVLADDFGPVGGFGRRGRPGHRVSSGTRRAMAQSSIRVDREIEDAVYRTDTARGTLAHHGGHPAGQGTKEARPGRGPVAPT